MPRERSRRVPWIERVFAGHHDILAALRSLRRSPGFVAIAVLSLGLAVGLNTTTFAMLDAIMHPYVPYKNPAELQSIGIVCWGRDRVGCSSQMYSALMARTGQFTEAVPYLRTGEVIGGSGGMATTLVFRAGPRFFDMLGVSADHGRVFHGRRDGTANVSGAVISSMVWHTMFGADPHLDHLHLLVGGVTWPVIGVLPATFPLADVVLPMPDAQLPIESKSGAAQLLVRLPPALPAPVLKQQLNAVSHQLAMEAKDDTLLYDYRVESLNPEPQTLLGIHMATAGASLLALLVACFNLANLMLARGLARRREVAVRLAVGAGTRAIARYVLTECAVLAVLGGSWGLLASIWGVKAAERYMPMQVSRFGFVAPHLNWRIMAVGFVTIAAAIFLVGVLPALRASRVNVNEAMKDGGSSSTGRTTRSQYVLVITEVAMSLVVMMAAALLIRAAHRFANDGDWGYDVNHVLSTGIVPKAAACSTSTTKTWLEDLETHVKAVPNVEQVAASVGHSAYGHYVTSDMPGAPIQAYSIGYTLTTPSYFRARGVRITEGRDFLPGDAQGPGVAIINREEAAILWPLQSPVGRLLKLGTAASNARWVRVVGVTGAVNRVAESEIREKNVNPVVVGPSTCSYASFDIRVKNVKGKTPLAIYQALRDAVPGGYVGSVASPNGWFENEVVSRHLIAAVFTMIAIFSLALATIGVYGILSYMVGQRYREFAMRIALGASSHDIFGIVWHDALVMVLAGIAVGAFGALAFGPLLGEYWLDKIGATDVISLVAAEAVLLLIALAACVVPMRRALRADPVDLLRST